jgi:D-alanine-D-alanine ligase
VPDDVFVFNLAYGIQGNCRYTHVPSLLEMMGMPYFGSGPRAHTICLDKYLAKMLLDRAELPTPAFQLVTSPGEPLAEELSYPLLVKPQFESTSFGMRFVEDRDEFGAAVSAILSDFVQPALVEAFIDGREVNCGLLGNQPPTALPVLEIDFGTATVLDRVATFEAKRDRRVSHICPADLAPRMTQTVQDLAGRAFQTLGCCDCARVDFRIDRTGSPFVATRLSVYKRSVRCHCRFRGPVGA